MHALVLLVLQVLFDVVKRHMSTQRRAAAHSGTALALCLLAMAWAVGASAASCTAGEHLLYDPCVFMCLCVLPPLLPPLPSLSH